jgi:signal transduction histidine kinase
VSSPPTPSDGNGEASRLLVLAPRGRDAPLTCTLLEQAGHRAEVVRGMADIADAVVHATANLALLDEECLVGGDRHALIDALAAQPAWSDFPLLVFGAAHGEHGPRRGERALAAFGNVTVVERPLTVRALLLAVDAALRGRRRQHEARRAIDMRDQFLAMLGHELRNPLAAIGLATVALERSASDASKRHVDVIGRQTEHLARLVDDLLDVSRVTSGKLELRKTPLDLRIIVERCLAIATERARVNGLHLEAAIPARPLVIDGDRVRLEQVINNLLGNAVKYTPRGGRVDVGVDEERGHAVVRVKDSGVGIAPEMLPRVFDLFVQAPGALSRSAGGLGIGLTVVRGLVERHGGSVEVYSEGLGRGAELVVRLPLAPMTSDAVDGSGEHAVAPSGARSIVVVDDSADVRESLKDYLEILGHRVATAADGPAGVERIIETTPAFALVDIGLPGIDGYEVARRVRDALGDSVTLVAITGYGQPRDKEAARQAGFDRHFTKPLDLDALRDLLHG